MEPGCGLTRRIAQCSIEDDLRPPLPFPVEEKPLSDVRIEHFLQAKRLGAQLDTIGIVRLWFPAFVFHRDDPPVAVELDDIALSGELQTLTQDRKSPRDPHSRPRFIGSIVSPLVQDGTLHGEAVLRPNLLQVDERALALAEEEVLEGGEGSILGYWLLVIGSAGAKNLLVPGLLTPPHHQPLGSSPETHPGSEENPCGSLWRRADEGARW